MVASELSLGEETRYAQLQALALDFARAGESESLCAMLAHGLPINLADAKGQTLLMLASYHGQAETTRMLLERGARVDQPNDRGQSPLAGAAFKGDLAIVHLLLDAGAEAGRPSSAGLTAADFARLFGRFEVAAVIEARQPRGRGRWCAHMFAALSCVLWPLLRVARALSRKHRSAVRSTTAGSC